MATFTKTINDTVGYVKVIDSLFSKREGFDINSLRVVPFSQGEEFELQAGYIKRGGLKVAVFEAKTPYMTYLSFLSASVISMAIIRRSSHAMKEEQSISTNPSRFKVSTFLVPY